jgi:hypothetical protein
LVLDASFPIDSHPPISYNSPARAESAMATVRIMYWKDIPYGVRGRDDSGQVTRQLPDRFQEAIDAAAMASGETSQEAYQAGFTWGPAEERPGTATEAADAAVGEILLAYPDERLRQMARRGED